MPKTCYLHIGSPKAGSTTIQAWCFKNKALLEQRGILYPGNRRRHDALLSVFHAATENLRFNVMRQDLTRDGADRAEMAADFAEAAASPADLVVYSNEIFLGQGGKIDLQALRDELLKHYDAVRVLCYVRDPYKLLISRAQEQIKGGVRSYEAVCANPLVVDILQLDRFIAVFGADAVSLRNFDAVVSGKRPLTEDFLTAIKPDVGLDGLDGVGEVNTGLSLEAALIVSGLNQTHGIRGDWKERHLRPLDVRGIGNTRFALPPETVLGVRDQLMAQYGYLARAGIAFTPPDWDALPEARPDWSGDTLEQIALAMNALAEEVKTKMKTKMKTGRRRGKPRKGGNRGRGKTE